MQLGRRSPAALEARLSVSSGQPTVGPAAGPRRHDALYSEAAGIFFLSGRLVEEHALAILLDRGARGLDPIDVSHARRHPLWAPPRGVRGSLAGRPGTHARRVAHRDDALTR